MITKALSLAAFVASLAPALAFAQGEDGSFYLRACSAAIKQADGGALSPEEADASIFCIGYVAGFLDANSLSSARNRASRIICMPERGITNDQGIRIFVKYLRDNPHILHESGRMSLYLSLAKALPCAK